MQCKVEWNGDRGSGVGNMKQTNIRNMECVGERDQEQGYEQISRNDKAGDNGPNQAGPEDRRRLHARSEARPELGR